MSHLFLMALTKSAITVLLILAVVSYSSTWCIGATCCRHMHYFYFALYWFNIIHVLHIISLTNISCFLGCIWRLGLPYYRANMEQATMLPAWIRPTPLYPFRVPGPLREEQVQVYFGLLQRPLWVLLQQVTIIQ